MKQSIFNIILIIILGVGFFRYIISNFGYDETDVESTFLLTCVIYFADNDLKEDNTIELAISESNSFNLTLDMAKQQTSKQLLSFCQCLIDIEKTKNPEFWDLDSWRERRDKFKKNLYFEKIKSNHTCYKENELLLKIIQINGGLTIQ